MLRFSKTIDIYEQIWKTNIYYVVQLIIHLCYDFYMISFSTKHNDELDVKKLLPTYYL